MATIGLDKLYYAKITEAVDGTETYGTPISLAKAMKADLSVELAEATLYADDGPAEVVKEFKSGTLSLGIDDIGVIAAEDLTGAKLDDNNVVVSGSEDGGTPVAVGFRAKKANGKYRYFWLYRVKFGIPATNLATKGDSITFSTPTIEGTVFRRNKLDGNGKHPWKAEVNEDDTSVPASVITGWYTQVYEPSFSPAPSNVNLSALTLGSLTLTPAFNSSVTAYTTATTNATNTVTATAADAGASIAITVGSTPIVNGQAATWAEGENTLSIVVTNGSQTKTYTVTVTKS
jgi:phi13 family phage major tail protein